MTLINLLYFITSLIPLSIIMKFQTLLGITQRTDSVAIAYGFLFVFYTSLCLMAVIRIKRYKSFQKKIRIHFRLFGVLIILICICTLQIGRIASFCNIFAPVDETSYEILNIIPCNNLIVIGILIFFLSYEDYNNLSGNINSNTFKLKLNLFKTLALLINLVPRILLFIYKDFWISIKYKELWVETILSFIVSTGLVIMSMLLIDRIKFLFEDNFKNVVKSSIHVVIFIYVLMLCSRILILLPTIWELNGNIPEEDGLK